MILFLSQSFLRRLTLHWNPKLSAFLVGDRNLYFFYPEALVPVMEISPATVENVLEKDMGSWQLLGFLSPQKIENIPGYVAVETKGSADPQRWSAHYSLPEENGMRVSPVTIQTKA